MEPRSYPRGSEHQGKTPEKPHVSQTGGAKSGALSPKTLPADADLAQIVAAWPTLPQTIKAGIVAMVKASTKVEGK